MKPRLFAVLLGGKPPGCTIEQHNVFFGIGTVINDLYPAIKKFWAVAPKIHIDAYMVIEQIGDYDIVPREKSEIVTIKGNEEKLFFVNLGGYRHGVFEEVHKKLFIIAADETTAVAVARNDSFFQEGVNEGRAMPHIDDKQTLDEFDDDAPVDVSTLVEPQGYILYLKRMRTGSCAYPEPIITGFLRIH